MWTTDFFFFFHKRETLLESWKSDKQYTMDFFRHCRRGVNSIIRFSIEVTVSDGVVLDCIILRGDSNILPPSCM